MPQENLKISLKLKKSSSKGLFRLFSKGVTSDLKQENTNSCKFFEEKWTKKPAEMQNSVAAGLRDIGLELGTCNYIRPTGLKLEPRAEIESSRNTVCSDFLASPYNPTPLQKSPTHCDTKLHTKKSTPNLPRMNLAKEKFRSRVSNDRILIKEPEDSFNLTVNNHIFQTSLRSPMMSPVTPVHATGLPAFASLKQQFVAGRIAVDTETYSLWMSWLNSYSKGEFNIQNPPDPPPLGPTFTHLPPIYPTNTAQHRNTGGKNNETLWKNWDNDQALKHLQGAMKKFDTKYAAISFIDDEYEQFKTEKGYNVSQIQRSNSIAAHVLYSTEVLSIVDTQKDWRFKNNPMVTGKPRIRFFAATPLINQDGHILGVLSVFSKEIRKNFTYDQRRQLAKYGGNLTADLMAQAECTQKKPSLNKSTTDSVENMNQKSLTVENASRTIKDHPNQENQSHKNNHKSDNYLALNKPLLPQLPELKDTVNTLTTQPIGQTLIRPSTSRSHILSETTPPSSVESSRKLSPSKTRDLPSASRAISANSRSDRRPRGNSLALSCRTTGSRTTSRTSKTFNDAELRRESLRDETSGKHEDSRCSPRATSDPSLPLPDLINSSLMDRTIPFLCDDPFSYNFDLCSIQRSFSSSETKPPNSLSPNSPSQTNSNQGPSHHPNLDMSVEDYLSLSCGDLMEDVVGVFSTENQSNYSQFPISLPINGKNYLSGQHSDNQHEFLDHENLQLKSTTYLNNSSTCCLQAMTRIPESFRTWKFPRFEPKVSSTNSSITSDTYIESDSSSHNINTSPSTTPTLSPTSNSFTPKEYQVKRAFQEKKNTPKFVNKVNLSNSIGVHSRSGNDYSILTKPSSNIGFSITRKESVYDGNLSAAPRIKSTILPQYFPQGSLCRTTIDQAFSSKRICYDLICYATYIQKYYNICILNETDMLDRNKNGIETSLLCIYCPSDTIDLFSRIFTHTPVDKKFKHQNSREKINQVQGILNKIATDSGPLKKGLAKFILGSSLTAASTRTSDIEDSIIMIKAIINLANKTKMTLMITSWINIFLVWYVLFS